MPSTLSNPLRSGLRQERVISPQCLVIFGASGDLTHRKLIPALFELYLQRRIPSEFGIVGCARRPWTCLLYTSPSPRDLSTSRMPSSA